MPKFDPVTGQVNNYLAEGKALKEHSTYAAKRGEGTALFGDDYPGTLEIGSDQ